MVLVLVLVWILEPLSHRQCRTTDRQFYQITAKSLAHSSTDRQFGQIINHWHTRRRTDNSAKSLAHSSTDRHFGQIKNHKLSTDGGGGMWYHMAVIHPPMPVGRRANDGRTHILILPPKIRHVGELKKNRVSQFLLTPAIKVVEVSICRQTLFEYRMIRLFVTSWKLLFSSSFDFLIESLSAGGAGVANDDDYYYLSMTMKF